MPTFSMYSARRWLSASARRSGRLGAVSVDEEQVSIIISRLRRSDKSRLFWSRTDRKARPRRSFSERTRRWRPSRRAVGDAEFEDVAPCGVRP